MSSILSNLYRNLEGYYLSYFKVDYLVKDICEQLDNFHFYDKMKKVDCMDISIKVIE